MRPLYYRQFQSVGRGYQLLALWRCFWIVKISKEPHPGGAGHNLAGELHLLGGQSGNIRLDARYISAGPRFAFDQTEMDGVSKRRANNRNDGRRSVCRNRSINSGSYNHVRFEINDLLRKCWQPIPKALRVTRHHVEVSAIDVTQVPHAIEKKALLAA